MRLDETTHLNSVARELIILLDVPPYIMKHIQMTYLCPFSIDHMTNKHSYNVLHLTTSVIDLAQLAWHAVASAIYLFFG